MGGDTTPQRRDRGTSTMSTIDQLNYRSAALSMFGTQNLSSRKSSPIYGTGASSADIWCFVIVALIRYGNWLSQSEAIHQSGSREVQLRARWSWSCTLHSDKHMGQGPSGSAR